VTLCTNFSIDYLEAWMSGLRTHGALIKAGSIVALSSRFAVSPWLVKRISSVMPCGEKWISYRKPPHELLKVGTAESFNPERSSESSPSSRKASMRTTPTGCFQPSQMEQTSCHLVLLHPPSPRSKTAIPVFVLYMSVMNAFLNATIRCAHPPSQIPHSELIPVALPSVDDHQP